MVEEIGGVLYYTVAEFSALLKVSQSTVERWISDGRLIYWQIKTSAPIRIPATELSRHLHPRNPQ
jgi:excisionase family DNA binding protein